MALPKHYRFVVENTTGATIAIGDIDISIVRMLIGPTDGAVNHEVSPVVLTNAVAINNAAFGVIGAAQDNSVGKFLEGNGNFSGVTPASPTPSGDLILRMETSPDGINWPDSAEASFVLAVLSFTTISTTKDKDFVF